MPVNNLNFVGIFIASLGLLGLLVANTLLYDCSAEFDLKNHLKDNSDDAITSDKHIEEKSDIDFDPEIEDTDADEESMMLTKHRDQEIREFVPLRNVLKGLGSSQPAMLIIVSTFITVFSLFGTDVLIPLLIENTFHWPMAVTSYVFISYGVLYFVILVVMSTFFTSTKSVYVSTIACLVCLLLQYVLLATIVLVERNKNRDIVLFTLFLSCWVVGWCLDAVLLRTLIAGMVPSTIQSFTETLRSGAARISTILASFIFPLITHHLHWTSIVMFALIFFIFLGFLGLFKVFLNPKEIVFNSGNDKDDLERYSCVFPL